MVTKTMKQTKKIERMLAGATLAASLASGVYAQESAPSVAMPTPVVVPASSPVQESSVITSIPSVTVSDSKVELKLREAYISGKDGGLYTQNGINYTSGSLGIKLKTLVETLPGFERVNYGADFRFKPGTDLELRLNVGYADISEGEDLCRTLFGVNGANNSFAGVSYQHVPEGDHFNFFGGTDLIDNLHIQGTFDTEGAARGVLFADLPQLGGFYGFGGGVNANGTWEGNISYNNEHLWASVRFGERPLDFRLVLGDVPKRQSWYFQNVTGSGINELDDGRIDDQTFKFNIGINGFFDYFGVEKLFLDDHVGSAALEFRFKEDNFARIIGSYRIGDIGPLYNSFVAPSVRYDFPTESFGGSLELGSNLFDKKGLEIRLKAEYRDNEARIGIFGGWEF